MLAGFERADRPLEVAGARQRNIDRVDLRVGQQVRVTAVDLGNVQLARRGAGLVDVARGQREEHGARRGVPMPGSANFLAMLAAPSTPQLMVCFMIELSSVGYG